MWPTWLRSGSGAVEATPLPRYLTVLLVSLCLLERTCPLWRGRTCFATETSATLDYDVRAAEHRGDGVNHVTALTPSHVYATCTFQAQTP
jgi:hypothetical protein